MIRAVVTLSFTAAVIAAGSLFVYTDAGFADTRA